MTPVKFEILNIYYWHIFLNLNVLVIINRIATIIFLIFLNKNLFLFLIVLIWLNLFFIDLFFKYGHILIGFWIIFLYLDVFVKIYRIVVIIFWYFWNKELFLPWVDLFRLNLFLLDLFFKNRYLILIKFILKQIINFPLFIA